MAIEERVNSFKTDSEWGFTSEEITILLKQYPGIDMDKFNSALMGVTCMSIDEKTRIYHCDIVKAIRCGVENRNLTVEEWD